MFFFFFFFFFFFLNYKKGKRKVQGVPQSQTAALPRPQEEEETDKSKQAQQDYKTECTCCIPSWNASVSLIQYKLIYILIFFFIAYFGYFLTRYFDLLINDDRHFPHLHSTYGNDKMPGPLYTRLTYSLCNLQEIYKCICCVISIWLVEIVCVYIKQAFSEQKKKYHHTHIYIYYLHFKWYL